MSRISLLVVALVFVELGCSRSQPLISGGKSPADWIKALEDQDATVRVEAVRKLGNIGTKDPTALPAVFRAFSDDDPAVRKEVIFAIVRTWPASRSALPELEKAKDNDKDENIRKFAAEAHYNLSLKK